MQFALLFETHILNITTFFLLLDGARLMTCFPKKYLFLKKYNKPVWYDEALRSVEVSHVVRRSVSIIFIPNKKIQVESIFFYS